MFTKLDHFAFLVLFVRYRRFKLMLTVDPNDRRILTQKKMVARQIIEGSLYVAANAAKKCSNPHYTYSDLFNEGVLGLYHALDKYNPGYGIEFQTYAYNWVREYIAQYTRKQVVKSRKHLSITSLNYSDGEGSDNQLEIAGKEREPVEILMSEEINNRLTKKIARLKDTDKKIIELRSEGYSYAEIGKEIGVSRQRIEQKMGYLRNLLH